MSPIEQRLDQFRDVPDFLAYLSHVLILCPGESDSHRAVAGLLLKNSVISRPGPPNDPAGALAINYVKATILQGLADKESMIRQTVAAVIAALLGKEDAGAWTEALDVLTKGMASQDINIVEVRFRLCES